MPAPRQPRIFISLSFAAIKGAWAACQARHCDFLSKAI